MVKLGVVALLVGVATVSMRGQWTPKVGEWPTYSGDLAATRYSPLDQINASNFGKLQLAFRFKTENLGPRPEFQFQSTPLMVNGRLFTTAGTRRAAVALDATTGEMLWMHSINEGKRGEAAPRQLSGRGLSYWSDGKSERVIYVTPGYQMVALDAVTGDRVAGFGTDGIVDLKLGLDQEGLDPMTARDRPAFRADHREGRDRRRRRTSRGHGSAQQDQREGLHPRLRRPNRQAPVGLPHNPDEGRSRLRDVGSGRARLHRQHRRVGADERRRGARHRLHASGIADRRLLRRPSPRRAKGPESNLYCESLVALDVKTGQKKWHYQLVHHGLWDHDIPCAPILMDLVVNGKPVKAVAQPTKQNWLYVFDRVTGKPVWPIEERPVEKGTSPASGIHPHSRS